MDYESYKKTMEKAEKIRKEKNFKFKKEHVQEYINQLKSTNESDRILASYNLFLISRENPEWLQEHIPILKQNFEKESNEYVREFIDGTLKNAKK